MARAVQRSLVSYLPTRKKALAVSHKDDVQQQQQQQQADAAQKKKAHATSQQQWVEIVRPALPAAPQHKRQRIARTETVEVASDGDEREQLPSSEQQQLTLGDEPQTSSPAEVLSAADNLSPPLPLSHTTTTSPAKPLSSSPSPPLRPTSPITHTPSSPVSSRSRASRAGAAAFFSSSEQQRQHDFIEQKVRDCLEVPPHLTAEPTQSQLAALVRPTPATRPPLPRAPIAAPSTPQKRRPTSLQLPVSSIAALSASTSTASFSPSSAFESPALSLPLPVSYRLLLSLFSALECAISVRSHSSALWSALSPAVVRIVQKTVGLSHLQQLVAVMGDCYELREERSADTWNRVKVDVRVARLRLIGEEKEADAGGVAGPVGTTSSGELAERRQLLQQRLLERANDEHNRWYSTSSHASQSFDPRTEGRWHSAFPLDSLPPLPKAEVKGSVRGEKVLALDALESLSGHKRRWEEVEPLTPRSSVSRSSSSVSELLLTPSTRGSTSSAMASLLDTPSTPFTARSTYVEQFRRRAAAKQFEHADRATPAQLERLQHLGKLPLLLDVVHYCLQTSGRHMMELDNLLALVASGNAAFSHGPALRLQFELLLDTLPAAFSRRSIGVAGAARQLVGLTRRMGVEEMRAALKAAKDREEEEMREERRLACEALLRSVEGDKAEVARVPHVASPAKRSLHSALMAVSPGGTERPVANNQAAAAAVDAVTQPASRQLYR